MRGAIEGVVDDGEFFEVQEGWAQNLVVGFARLDGHAVGVVGNQPMVLAAATVKKPNVNGARVGTFSRAVYIPLLTFVGVPGVLPGAAPGRGGVILPLAHLPF